MFNMWLNLFWIIRNGKNSHKANLNHIIQLWWQQKYIMIDLIELIRYKDKNY